jgi:hypothetical protein
VKTMKHIVEVDFAVGLLLLLFGVGLPLVSFTCFVLGGGSRSPSYYIDLPSFFRLSISVTLFAVADDGMLSLPFLPHTH